VGFGVKGAYGGPVRPGDGRWRLPCAGPGPARL